MAESLNTWELWAAEGMFEPYKVQRSWSRHVPDDYLKSAQWGIVDGDESYHTQSRVENDDRHYPVGSMRTLGSILHSWWRPWTWHHISGRWLTPSITTNSIPCWQTSKQHNPIQSKYTIQSKQPPQHHLHPQITCSTRHHTISCSITHWQLSHESNHRSPPHKQYG